MLEVGGNCLCWDFVDVLAMAYFIGVALRIEKIRFQEIMLKKSFTSAYQQPGSVIVTSINDEIILADGLRKFFIPRPFSDVKIYSESGALLGRS